MPFTFDTSAFRFEPRAISPAILACCAPSHRFTTSAGEIRCVICRSTSAQPTRLNAPRGFWVCMNCLDTRERCTRGPRRHYPKASAPPLAHSANPIQWDDPTYGRCACGLWVPAGMQSRHLASDARRYLLPITLSMKGRVLLTGAAGRAVMLALGGADGKIGGAIHPALAQWFPVQDDVFANSNSWQGRGVIAVTESVYDLIRRSIESVPVETDSAVTTWASAFLMAYDVQNSYSKAPLSMWQWLMPATLGGYAREQIEIHQGDLMKRLGATLIERARNTVWARQIAAAHGEG